MKPQEMLEKAGLLLEESKLAAVEGDPDKAQALVAEAKEWKEKALQTNAVLTSAQKELDELVQKKQEGEHRQPGSQFKYWGEFLQAAQDVNFGKFDARLRQFKDAEEINTYTRVKDMSGATGSSGGFLIPDEFSTELRAAMQQAAIIRQRATVLPMRRRTIKVPVLDQTGTTPGQPHWFGGLIFYWEDEGADHTASDASFKEIELVARKLVGFTRSPDELMDDAAISLEAFLQGPLGFVGGVSWMEDFAFLMGNGVGKPLGVINAPCTKAITRNTAAHIKFEDLINMIAAFLGGEGVWVASQTVMAELLGMNGPTGNPAYLWGDASKGVPNTLLGYPIVFTEKTPPLGIKGDIGLYDFRYYLVGDRQADTVESTKFEKWAADKTSWKIRHRVDGKPWLEKVITLQDGTTEVSPFVTLT
jgi:HK97 family phage major capsid protein